MTSFTKRVYYFLIAPKQRHEDTRNRELVLNVLLAGALLISLMTFFYLVSRFAMGSTYLGARLLSVTGITLSFVGLHKLSRNGWLKTSALLLVGLYYLLATVLVLYWGILLPIGVLLFGLIIVLAGILLGSVCSLYTWVASVVTLVAAQAAADMGVIHPDWSWTAKHPVMSDVVGFAFVLGVIAVVSWLFNHQMERSLKKAEQAEAALKKQKDALEETVIERTRELQEEQLQRTQQMYRFAELGQLSTALLHDLANHLSTLTLDIEGLEGQTRSRALTRIKRSIHYIDDMVVRVRDQLQGRGRVRAFNVVNEIEKIVTMLHYRAAAKRVNLIWEIPNNKTSFKCRGEPVRFHQLMANLITNAIDAYEGVGADSKREVEVVAKQKAGSIIILVSDWGKGIPEGERSRLFKPFFSTKNSGMGMGLYIVRQVAEEHFLGSVVLEETKDHTVFRVVLPGVN